MKKGLVIISVFLFVILLISLTSAQNETIDEKAYSCLKNKLGDKCGNSNSVEQLAFSLLAISDNSAKQKDCKSQLLDKQKSDDSFGTIKDTALAIIALDYTGKSTDDEQEWLLSKKKNAGLEWYLEIDSNEETQCEVSGTTVSIGEDKKIKSVSSNSCFSKAFGNYWLKIADNCLNKNITVSCNKGFLSTLVYKKSGSNTWHITSDIQAASASGKTQHKINSYCFSATTTCDYEGSLWAALALQKTDNSISEFLPYLVAFSEDNDNLFPESFLYLMTDSQEYLNEILTLQKSDGSWKQGNNEYYDTALGLLALAGDEVNAISFLEQKQGNDGCWNSGNIRDTAFILWAAWPRTSIISDGTSKSNCEPTYDCTTKVQCDKVLGNILDSYDCLGIKECCDTPPEEESCTDRGGQICPSGKICSIPTFSTPEGACCTGDCQDEEPECEQYNYKCKITCSEDEETDLYDCPSEKICCKLKPTEETSYWWVYLLVVLIVLVILGIIFRDKLRIFLFKLKGGFKKGPVTKTYPRFPPSAGVFRPAIRRPAMPPPRFAGRTVKRAETKEDKELEETMRKLKEMSK